jgi:DNA-binding ferritin-like protein (Dps family)
MYVELKCLPKDFFVGMKKITKYFWVYNKMRGRKLGERGVKGLHVQIMYQEVGPDRGN